jgi:tRNA-specific 2-thiouridylase
VTGHYARLDTGPDGRRRLRRGADPAKDQSYFLFSMPPAELDAIEFPLGDLSKDEVRRRARRYGLPNADKADSQEICFVPDGDYAGFVERGALTRRRRAPGAGDIVATDGAVVGRHDGIHRYTVGQRRGLGNVNLGGRPAYVARIDAEQNRVVVGDRADARRQSLEIGEVRWLVPPPEAPVRAEVQVRHRASPTPAQVTPAADLARVAFDGGVVASPGQAAVFYQGDQVLGGGWIRPG